MSLQSNRSVSAHKIIDRDYQQAVEIIKVSFNYVRSTSDVVVISRAQHNCNTGVQDA